VTAVDTPVAYDGADIRLALRAPGLLRQFNEAGVLSAVDVHVAQRLGALGGEADEVVLLGIALAVRAPRLAHVFTDLAIVHDTAVSDLDEVVDLTGLPWPAVDDRRGTSAAPSRPGRADG
jgi:exodeoxyribonuclease V alpha subunit